MHWKLTLQEVQKISLLLGRFQLEICNENLLNSCFNSSSFDPVTHWLTLEHRASCFLYFYRSKQLVAAFSAFPTTASFFGVLLNLELTADLPLLDTTHSWEWNLLGSFALLIVAEGHNTRKCCFLCPRNGEKSFFPSQCVLYVFSSQRLQVFAVRPIPEFKAVG